MSQTPQKYSHHGNVLTPVHQQTPAPRGGCLGSFLRGLGSLGAGAAVGAITLEHQLANLPAVCHNEYILEQMPAACPQEPAAYFTAVIAAAITAAAIYYGPGTLIRRMLP